MDDPDPHMHPRNNCGGGVVGGRKLGGGPPIPLPCLDGKNAQ